MIKRNFIARCTKRLIMDDGSDAGFTVGKKYVFMWQDNVDHYAFKTKTDDGTPHFFGALDYRDELSDNFCSGDHFELVSYSHLA